MHQNTRRHLGVHWCFRDVYFLRGSFRREKVYLFSLCVFERLIRMQITERFKLISLDFGFV